MENCLSRFSRASETFKFSALIQCGLDGCVSCVSEPGDSTINKQAAREGGI